VRPQHLAPNDQMVFFQTVGTCMDKEAFAKQSFTFRAEYTDPLTKKRATITKTMTFGEMLSGLNASIRKTQAAIPAIEALYKRVAGQIGEGQCTQAANALSTAMSTGGLTADADLRDLKTTLGTACTQWR
jgi:Ca-activated chloride channel homolog